MIARNDVEMQRNAFKVYPIVLFEVTKESSVPKSKTELQEMLKSEKAIPFHKIICSDCHLVPDQDKWLNQSETEGFYFILYLISNSSYIIFLCRSTRLYYWETYGEFHALGTHLRWITY